MVQVRREVRRARWSAGARPRSPPDSRVSKQFGVRLPRGVAFGFEQDAGGLPAARHRHLAPRIAEPLVDGVNRKAEAARGRFRIMAAHDQAKRLLLLFGEGLETFVRLRVHATRS